MSSIMTEDELTRIHGFSFKNRSAIEASDRVGCFDCMTMYAASEIQDQEYVDEADGQETATCPYCFTDSVIPDNSITITAALLNELHKRYCEFDSATYITEHTTEHNTETKTKTQEMNMPDTTTTATNAAVPASFRYFGDVTQARSGDSGILAMATHLNKATGQIAVGISLTPPGVRYDKAFSRAVALFRLRTHLAETVEELSAAESELRIGLLSVRGRVKKTSTVTKLTEAEYKAERAKHVGAGPTNHANVGYRATVNEYFTTDDFTGSVEEFTFTVPVPDESSHLLIDKEILEYLVTDKMYPKWLTRPS